MEFAFICPGANEELSLTEKSKVIGSWPPLGILYVATVLRDDGLGVSILDQAAKGYSIEDTVRWVEKINPEILGFSALASSGKTAARIARMVKERNPNVITVFGNYYATFNEKRILTQYPQVDIVVRGEGEETTRELVKAIEEKRSLKRVRGITFREGEDIVSTPDRPLIKRIDDLPIPDRTLLDVEYHSTLIGAIGAPERFTTLLSSRGCPYRCRFCGCQKIVHGVWRARSVENTFDELEFLTGEGYKQFLFVDDSFTINQKRIIELCKRIIEAKLDIEWICEGRVNHASYGLMRYMVKAGCKIIYFGIESANQRILDYYRKQVTLEQSRNAVRTTRKAGMDIIVGSFIVGAPTETQQEIEKTLGFAEKVPLDVPQFNILGVFPGMELWDEFKAEGYLSEDDVDRHWEMGIGVANIHPDTVPYEKIKDLVRHYYRRFFIKRPSFLLSEAARTIKSSFRLKIIKTNMVRINEIRRGWKDFVAFEGEKETLK